MNCPYCAEEIQDAAILCRYCGAAKNAQGNWSAAGQQSGVPIHHKGQSTIKLAGAFFVISSAVSIATLTSSVPLFGAMRSGTIALVYNIFYAILFLGIGIGIIVGRVWGYRLFWVGTIIYTIDTLAFLLNKHTRDAYLAASGVTREVGSLIDVGMFDQGIFFASMVSLGCWWGFALFVYFRRAYFRRR